jgi:uncharacterized protein (DUF433 family)
MADTDRLYSPAEAAAVTGIAVKAVHNAIDKKIVEPLARESNRRRALTVDDLLRLKLWYGVGTALTAARRKRLFEAIAERPAARTVKADDLLIVDVAEARRQIAARIRDLDEAEAAVHSVKGRYTAIMGGEPVFKGTRIPVRMIAAMLDQDVEEDEILEGCPSLTERMLELSRIWAAAHPSRGRPKTMKELGYKPTSTVVVPLKGDPLRSSSRKAGKSAVITHYRLPDGSERQSES